jgi:hypothetical protein
MRRAVGRASRRLVMQEASRSSPPWLVPDTWLHSAGSGQLLLPSAFTALFCEAVAADASRCLGGNLTGASSVVDCWCQWLL